MKSLQESLFDKDLVKKDLKFRDVYDLLAGHAGMQVWGMPIGQLFSPNKVIKYKNPYHPGEGFFNDYTAGFLGIIMDMPVPSDSEIKRGSGEWCQKLMSKQYLGKYVLPSWKHEYDEKFEVQIRPTRKEIIEVVLRQGNFGGVVYTLKRKIQK